MRRIFFLLAIALFLPAAASGCAGNRNLVAPAAPETQSEMTLGTLDHGRQSETPPHTLWGLWQFTADIEAGTLDVIQLREGNFHLNALLFLEPPALVNLTLESLKIIGDTVDADIGLRHPFLGLTEFTGFDVCGILITNGSLTGFSDSTLRMAGANDTHLVNADGYSRWWNPAEFPVNNKTMFAYQDGLLGTKDSSANYNSTLNAYKYYCDGLGANDPLSSVGLEKRGMFSAGAKNIRHYTIKLGGAGLVFNYAVDACWVFPVGSKPWTAPDSFGPDANRPEAWRADVKEVSNSLWNDGTSAGGALLLSIDVYDWYNAALNSVQVDSPGNFPPAIAATPTDGGTGYSTYEIEIINATPAAGSINMLISVESEAMGYGGLLPGKITTAYFTHTAAVSSVQQNSPPICDVAIDPNSPPMPFEGWGAFVFDASGSHDPDGDPLTFEWDFNNDGVFGDYYNFGTPDKPVKVFEFTNKEQVCVKVSDNHGANTSCCVNVDIVGYLSKNISLQPGVAANDIAIDHPTGDLWVLYDDKTIWKYPRSSWYQSGSEFFPLWASTDHAYWIDICPNGHSIIAGDYASNDPLTLIYDPSGNMLMACMQGGPGFPNVEVFAITSGVYLNHLGNILGWITDNATFAIRYPDGDWFDGAQWHYYWPTDYDGYDQIYYGYIKGVESDTNGNFLWYLEDAPDYYVSRWKLSTDGFPYSQTYDDAYFGTGSKTDDAEGWNAAKDITRDDLNRYFVLDELSTGEPRVKAWTVSGNNTTSIGGFGDSVTISEAPRRIEGSDYEGNIVVLHGDSASAGYKISVFLPGEMPK